MTANGARERELRDVPPRGIDRSSWPSNVRPIGIDEMDALGVGTDGLIYWHGKQIEVRQKFELRKFELCLLAAATFGALLQGIAAMFPFIPQLIGKWLGFA